MLTYIFSSPISGILMSLSFANTLIVKLSASLVSVIPGMNIANSSPPRRMHISCSLHTLWRLLATAIITASPTTCPYVSLTFLNLSQSRRHISPLVPSLIRSVIASSPLPLFLIPVIRSVSERYKSLFSLRFSASITSTAYTTCHSSPLLSSSTLMNLSRHHPE